MISALRQVEMMLQVPHRRATLYRYNRTAKHAAPYIHSRLFNYSHTRDVKPSVEMVDEVEYYQCRLGPDQWSKWSKIFKELEADVSLTNPQYNTWNTTMPIILNRAMIY